LATLLFLAFIKHPTFRHCDRFRVETFNNFKNISSDATTYSNEMIQQQSWYLVMVPVKLTSIFLKRAVEKNEGSLHNSFATDLNSAN